MKIIVLILSFVCCFKANAEDSLTAKKITITTSLTDYVPSMALETIRYNLGVEVYVKKGKSIYTNIGYIYSNGSAGGFFKVSSLGTKGMSLEVEGRHYLKKHRIIPAAAILVLPHLLQFYTQERLNTGYYLGINTFYQYTLTQRESPNKNPYNVSRNNVGLLAVVGYQCLKKYKLILDHSIGFGLLFVQAKPSNEFGIATGRTFRNFNEDKSLYPHISYNFRIGF